MKVNAGKSKVIVLSWEEGLECEVFVDGKRLEHLLEFKYLGCILDESGTYARGLELQCARVLHETLLLPFLMCGSVTVT